MTLQLVLAMLMVGRAQPPQPVLVGSTPVFMVGGFSAYIVLLPTMQQLPGNYLRVRPVLP